MAAKPPTPPAKNKSPAPPPQPAKAASSCSQAGVTASQAGVTARPLKPSQSDIDAGVAGTVKTYMKELIPYVQERLLALLKQKDKTFVGTLAEAPPFKISSDVRQAFKNFREPWDMRSCLSALTSTQLYEAAGTIFWLDILGTKFGDHVLTDHEVTWRQLEDGMSLWGEAAFIASCDDPRYRRFIFPGYLPVVIASLSHIESMIKAGTNHFNNLCVVAGQPIVFAWYQALADALQDGDSVKAMQLYEAGMTAVLRIRFTSSNTQVVTDAHVWTEVARASKHAGSGDFFDFVKRVAAMPDVEKKATSVEKLCTVLKDLGIQYNCKPVEKAVAMAVRNAMPIVKDSACLKSLGPLRELFPALINEPSKVMRVCQVCKTAFGDALMIEHLSVIFQSLFAALMREDITEPEVTISFLVGQGKEPGFVQLCGLKKQILEFMFRAVHLAVEHKELQKSSEAIINKVLPKFQTQMDAYCAFNAKTGLTVDAAKVDGQESQHDSDDETKSKLKGSCDHGNTAKFDAWLATLGDKGAQAAAQLFYDLCTGVHDEEDRSAM